jgi:hypothetical protein
LGNGEVLVTKSTDKLAVRRLPPPWTVEQVPGGYKVLDANEQSLKADSGHVFLAN